MQVSIFATKSRWMLLIPALLAAVLSACASTPGREQPLGYIVSLAFSPDGKLLAVTTMKGEVALLDPQPLRFRRMLSREADMKPAPPGFGAVFRPLPLAISPDGALIAAGGLEGGVVVWDIASGDEKYRIPTGSRILEVLFLPSANELVIVGPEVAIQSVRDGGRIGELPVPNETTATAAAASPDGRVLIVGLSNGAIAVFDAINRTLLRTLKAHEVAVTGVAFRPDGTAFASTAGGYDLRLWKRDVEDQFNTAGTPGGTAASSASERFGNAQAGGLLLWLLGSISGYQIVGAPTLGAPPVVAGTETQFAQAARTTPFHCGSRVAFSASGRYLASTANLLRCRDCIGTLAPEFMSFVTDLETGTTINMRMVGCAIAVSPDGRIVATPNMSAPLLWDGSTGQRLP